MVHHADLAIRLSDARIVQVALENAQRMAADLNKKWYADCERLIDITAMAQTGTRHLELSAEEKNGSAASELRADAHGCIMVRVLGPTGYKVADGP